MHKSNYHTTRIFSKINIISYLFTGDIALAPASPMGTQPNGNTGRPVATA